MMSERIEKWLRKRKDEYDRAKEPFSLNPNPMVKEGQLAGLIALPLLGFLVGLIYVAKTYYVTQQEFALFTMVGMGLWVCLLVVIYAVSISNASKFFLFDREFGFTERLHPRCEIYCKPEDIRELVKPEDEMPSSEDLKEKLQEAGFEKELIEKIADTLKNPGWYMYYFRHKERFQGWDADKQEIPIFGSHILFTHEPFEKQFVFGSGQENWYGPILYNHPHAESDNVKVLGWALDPFTSEPMPLCVLLHNSVRYTRLKDESDEEIEEKEAWIALTAVQHGAIDGFRKERKHLKRLVDAKWHDIKNIFNFGDDIARERIEEYQRIKKAVPRRIWSKGWFKVLVSIVSIIAIVICVGIILQWFDLSAIFG